MSDTKPPARWPRDMWLDAMWDCETVKPNERVVAYTYARYAGKNDVVWCSWDELRRRTGIRSRDAVNRAVSGLLISGWLLEVEKARQHYSARYRLKIPDACATAQESVSRTSQQSGKRTSKRASSPGNETSSPSPETSSPFAGPDLSNGLLEHSSQTSGGTLPPDPLRTQDLRSSGLGTELQQEPSVGSTSTTQVDLSTQVPPVREIATAAEDELSPEDLVRRLAAIDPQIYDELHAKAKASLGITQLPTLRQRMEIDRETYRLYQTTEVTSHAS